VKKKINSRMANVYAEELIELLDAMTNKISVAGSLRRKEKLVSDIEIVLIPRMVHSRDLCFSRGYDGIGISGIQT